MSSGYTALRLLEPSDDIASFDCGVPSLDTYLHKRALANQIADVGRCYVTTHDSRVVAYYTLGGGSVTLAELPTRLRKNMPRIVPTLVIGRLAVDREHRGRGLAAGMVRHAVLNAVAVADIGGFKMLIVHTDNDASRAFWRHHEFDPMPENDYHLMLTLKDARAALGQH